MLKRILSIIILLLLLTVNGWAATDTFTGNAATAINTHDANWSVVTGTTIGNVTLDGSGNIQIAGWQSATIYYSTSTSDTSIVTILANIGATTYGPSPVVRAGASEAGYRLILRNVVDGNYTTLQLNKSGVMANSAAVSVPVNSTHILELTYSSGHLLCTVDGEQLLDHDDSASPLAAGSPGISIDSLSSSAVPFISEWTDVYVPPVPVTSYYYVYPGLSTGSNNGTSWANAWKTLTDINYTTLHSAAVKGPTYLYVKKGTTASYQLPIAGSGASDDYRIIITTDPADTGSAPIIKSSTAITGFTSLGGGIYSVQPTAWAYNSMACWVDTTTLLKKGTNSNPAAGYFWIDTETTPYTLYVHLADGSDPATHTIDLSGKADGTVENIVYVDNYNYLTIDGLKFIHGDQGPSGHKSGGIRIASNTAHHITVQNCEIAYAIGGIFSQSSGINLLIQNNYLHDIWDKTEYPSGNGHGIVIYGGVVRYNRIDGAYVGVQTLPGGQPSYVYYNLIINSHTNGSMLGGGSTSKTYFYNNTIDHNPTYASGHAISVQGETAVTGYVDIKNNLAINQSTSGHCELYTRTDYADLTTDNNLCYVTNGGFLGGMNGVNYTVAQLSDWQAALTAAGYSGADANIVLANPLLKSSSDYHLTSTSPAKNTGVDVGLTTDIEENSIKGNPDMGCYEYQGGGGTFFRMGKKWRYFNQ
ncbi:MAG: hypothetical protein ABFD50_18950 [Smithella sp.]